MADALEERAKHYAEMNGEVLEWKFLKVVRPGVRPMEEAARDQACA